MTNADQLIHDPEPQRPLLLHMREVALKRGDTAALQAAGLIMQTATDAAIAILLAYEGAAKLPESSYAAVVSQLDESLPEPAEVPQEPAAIPAPRRPPTFSRSPSPPSGVGRPAPTPRMPTFPKQPPSMPKQPPRITGPDPTDDEIPF